MTSTIPAADVAGQLLGIRDAVTGIAVRVGLATIAQGNSAELDAAARTTCEALAAIDGAALSLLECELGDLNDYPEHGDEPAPVVALSERITRSGSRRIDFPGGTAEVPEK